MWYAAFGWLLMTSLLFTKLFCLITVVDKVREASVLFVDNPVGAGFSYVDESIGNYTTNIQQITDDLISFSRQFIDRFSQFSVVNI